MVWMCAMDSFAEVATVADLPFVVLFSQDGSDEADDGVVVGEDADDVGPPLDSSHEPFEGVGRPDLLPVGLGEG